ncbi:YqiJ family protein [Qipengyuania zhejiangensis]|uniref:YqiJ family protein n=1 Tax=Qipengyuania zhejiangensis TaxID=3077782 RepID=UPI002D78E689|nr:YqiJ family protein [Qipengyuania sp. Z2]
MTLLEPHNMPFAAALVLMAILALVQLIGLGDMFGADADLDLDGGADANAAITPGLMDGLSSLIGLGRVPLTIWAALFLMLFAGIGVGIQQLADSFTGAPLDRWLAAVLAAAGAIPATGVLARPLGAILPQDETTAVSLAALVGRRAVITDGIARTGSPARARVRDVHGQAHYVMVEPHETSSELHAGDEVLLVRREGNTFYATALAERRLSPTPN